MFLLDYQSSRPQTVSLERINVWPWSTHFSLR
jgi:hypothetical protein